MKYERIVSYVANQLWAITHEKLAEIVSVLAFRASGQEFTDAEIEARLGGRPEPTRMQGNAIGVVPIRGTIAHRMNSLSESSGGTSAEGVSRMLRAAFADDSIGTVMLDVDSPGGTVTGVPELADELFELRGRGTKRVVAMVNGQASSAAYWIASQADEIVSIPSGTAGSIGVFTIHEDLSKALEKEGVDVTVISAGKHKTEMLPFSPLSDEARAVLQGRVDTVYGQFLAAVARGRGVSADTVRNGFGEGRALTATDALKAGLIDRIATFDQVVSEIAASSPATIRAEVPDVDRRRRLAML